MISQVDEYNYGNKYLVENSFWEGRVVERGESQEVYKKTQGSMS